MSSRKPVFLISLSLFLYLSASSQISISPTDCGLTYVYDNAGNRIARLRIDCLSPPPSGKTEESEVAPVSTSQSEDSILSQIELSILYPNPTTGKVKVVFTQMLEEAYVLITDNMGKKLFESPASGYEVPLDLSPYAPGIYYVTIRTSKNHISKSVIKQ